MSYEDILHVPRHISPRRAAMSSQDRAAQFAPFAALTGYDAVIEETARLTASPAELEEDRKAELNETLLLLQEQIHQQPPVRITFFQPDVRKTGGAYVTLSCRIRKIDPVNRYLVTAEGTQIPIDAIVMLQWDTPPENRCGGL